jgi:hypothetical protein
METMITSEQRAILERAFEHMSKAVDEIMSHKLDGLRDQRHLRATRQAIADARDALFRLLNSRSA